MRMPRLSVSKWECDHGIPLLRPHSRLRPVQAHIHVHVHVHIYIHFHVLIHVYLNVYEHVQVHVHVHVQIYVHVGTGTCPTHVCTVQSVHVCMSMFIFMFMYVHRFMYMYMFVSAVIFMNMFYICFYSRMREYDSGQGHGLRTRIRTPDKDLIAHTRTCTKQ